jgi:hypothetical protein
MKKEITPHRHYREPFREQNRARWKDESGLVVLSEVYDDETKDVSREILERMRDTKEEVDEERSVEGDSNPKWVYRPVLEPQLAVYNCKSTSLTTT